MSFSIFGAAGAASEAAPNTNSRASTPSRATWTRRARPALLSACSASLMSSGLSSTSRMSARWSRKISDRSSGRALKAAPGLGILGVIDHEPVFSDISHRLGELLEIDRLDDIAVHSHLVGPHDVPLLGRGGEHDDRDRARARIALDAPQNLMAVDFRQFQIQQDQLRLRRHPFG